jgi:16S rRNA (uracil1498-N3)-methyltransferase
VSKYFRIDERLEVGGEVALDPHRFERVLRVRVGERLTVCDREGCLYVLEIEALSPPRARALGPVEGPDRNPRGELEVWVPLLKGGRTDDLVRQLTELGATRIVPFSSRHSVVRLESAKAAERARRFAQIAEEAGNQCGRTRLPEVVPPVDGLPIAGPGVFLWEGEAGHGVTEALRDGEASSRILVGPEGGLSSDEAGLLVTRGWRPATLGARILRAETAVVLLATLALAAKGEFDPRP